MQEKYLEIKDICVRYKVSGSGEPLLMLHGWGGSADSFDMLIEELEAGELEAKGYRIIVPDFPGFGKTEAPDEVWDVNRYRDFVFKFMDVLEIERFFLLTHSFGGRVAIKMAVAFPERIRKMILCASSGIKPKLKWKRKIFKSFAMFGKSIFSLPLLRNFAGFMRKILYKLVGSGDYAKLSGFMKKTFQNVISEDLTSLLSDIQVPTELVWGTLDHKTPLSDGKIMETKIPHARLHIFEGVRHGVHKEVPKKIVAIVYRFFSV